MSETIVRINVMVTYIDISVMLDREIVSACLSKSARSRRYAAPSCQCRIEHAEKSRTGIFRRRCCPLTMWRYRRRQIQAQSWPDVPNSPVWTWPSSDKRLFPATRQTSWVHVLRIKMPCRDNNNTCSPDCILNHKALS